MRTNKTTIVLSMIFVLLFALPAVAVRKGRLIGRVVDPDGNPIEGVTVEATSDEVPDFNEIRETDNKGIFKLDFEVIEVVYKYRFSKTGYVTLKTEQTWNKDGTDRHDFVLTPGENPAVGEAVPVTGSSEAAAAYNKAVGAFQAKDLATAAASFRKALEFDPELRQGWVALSIVELELEHYQEAAEAAEKAIELGSTDPVVLRTRWEAYRQLGDEEKMAAAQTDLERVGRLAEEAKRIYNEGVALIKEDDKEGAFAKFQEALGADPNLKPALLAVAMTGLETGHAKEAAQACETILKDDPQNEEALRLRYNAALDLDDSDMVIDSLVALAPIEPEAAKKNLWLLAMAAYDANDLDVSVARFNKVLEVDPGNAQAHYLLGLVYVGEGENDLAEEHLARFLELAPDDPDAASAREILDYLKSQ